MFKKPISNNNKKKKRIAILFSWINLREKSKGNQEWTIKGHWQHWGIWDRGRRQTKHKKQQQKRWATHTPPINLHETSCSQRVSSYCLLYLLNVLLSSMYIYVFHWHVGFMYMHQEWMNVRHDLKCFNFKRHFIPFLINYYL